MKTSELEGIGVFCTQGLTLEASFMDSWPNCVYGPGASDQLLGLCSSCREAYRKPWVKCAPRSSRSEAPPR
jgi:hypothetical protein